MPRKRRLSTLWFDGLVTDEEKSEREKTVMAALPTMQILANILKKELRQLERKHNYDSPAWQYEIALDNGQKKKLNDLLTLLTPVIGEIEND